MATTLNLNGKWKVLALPLSAKGETGLRKLKQTRGGWLEARVPGEIHLDLKRADKMLEPLESTNAPRCRWPEKKSWWYRTPLNASASLLAHERIELIFDGLDLYAQVFLNGKLAGEAKNAFVPAVFDAKPFIKRGRNDLIVRLTAGTELTGQETKPIRYTKTDPFKNRYFDAMGQLRKAQFSYGWDWVDSLPNIGIWRGVRIEGRSGVALHDLRLDTAFHGKEVYLEMTAVLENLHPWSDRACVLELIIAPPGGKRIRRRYTVNAQIGRSSVHAWIEIPHAQLWWPNGMGDQPLYHVTARVIHAGAASDSREFDIGLRTVDIDRSSIASGGSRFCVRVNGEDVFCKGGNWIPCDAIMARADAKRYQALISEAAYANVNMLRVWGGGIYEDDAFYDACNRSGILVWQDFMYACSEYPDDHEAFRDVARSEAEAVIVRLRHHACIALWCGNNENNELFAYWNRGKTFGKEKMKIGGMRLYNQVLPDACRSLDPNRPYWPGSPLGGERPTNEEAGDAHW